MPADGNCTKTLAHLDPYKRGQATPCDKANLQTCEVGDLSGKHGAMNSPAHNAKFLELYASTQEGIGAFFGNRSVVIHYANSTRITCANFVAESEGSYPSDVSEAPYPTVSSTPNNTYPNSTIATYTATPAPTGGDDSTPAPPAPTPTQVDGSGASRVMLGSGAVLGALIAMLL